MKETKSQNHATPVSGQVERVVSQRVIVWFSCGTASAVALKLAKEKYGEVFAVYCDTGSEHPSNKQFLEDVEQWTGIKIKIIKNTKYVNHFDVFLQCRFISTIKGAICTNLLKKQMREKYQRIDDIQIMGYTLEEQEKRAKKFQQRFPDVNCEWILIDNNLTKQDCTGLIWKSGIILPRMYDLGYNHNNCIGCVKGKKGYWNKIRKDFPGAFLKMSTIERELGYAILRKNNGEPLYLDELNPNEGNFKHEPPITCGFDCELLYQHIHAG